MYSDALYVLSSVLSIGIDLLSVTIKMFRIVTIVEVVAVPNRITIMIAF
jgi:hypothetical protein